MTTKETLIAPRLKGHAVREISRRIKAARGKARRARADLTQALEALEELLGELEVELGIERGAWVADCREAGYTYREIATSLGVGQERVRQIEGRERRRRRDTGDDIGSALREALRGAE